MAITPLKFDLALLIAAWALINAPVFGVGHFNHKTAIP